MTAGVRTPLLAAVGAVVWSSVVPQAHDPLGTVTWTGDVARIVRARCTSCHDPGGKAPMSLATYAAARPWARAIREEVLARRMPKWHAARGYGDFRNDPSLSPFEIALIVAWVDGGAPLGLTPPDQPATAPSDPGGRSDGSDPSPTRNVAVPCVPVARSSSSADSSSSSADRNPLPEGRLLALRPQLAEGASAAFVVALPDGQRHMLAWIRRFERKFETTYWLRRPMDLPRGSRLITEGAPCTVILTLTAP